MSIELVMPGAARVGVGWNISASVAAQLTGFLRAVLMARLLAPHDFGLFGMALTVIAGVNALTAASLDQSIVAHQFETRAELKTQLDTVWSAELIRGVLATLLLLACAIPASWFYGTRELRLVIVVLSLSLL